MKKIVTLIIITILISTTAYATEWYAPVIEKVKSLGIMQGDERGFRPQDTITRAEVAQIIVNLLESDINTVSKVIPSSVQIQSGNQLGSGVYVTNTHILTASHILSDTPKITLYNGKQCEGRVVKNSSFYDLAIIEVQEQGTPIKITESLTQGETVLVIGNPLSLNKSVSRGIVSAIERIANGKRTIQIDAPINHGNSGGAVVNMKGELVGIVNSKFTDNDAEGLGFAIHYKTITNFVKK